MCLTFVDEQYDENDNEVGYGYKVFSKSRHHEGRLFGPYWDVSNNTGYEYNTEYTSKPERIPTAVLTSYVTGFYVFTKKKDAKQLKKDLSFSASTYCVRRVKYRGRLARGAQHGEVMVARYMTILPPRKLLDAERIRGTICSWFGRFTKNKTGD